MNVHPLLRNTLAALTLAAAARAQTNTFPSSGNVGVGTTTPVSPLNVVSNNANALTISGNSSASIGLMLDDSAAANGRSFSLFSSGGGLGPAGTFGIYDNAAGATRLSISSGGNVGIGTANPGEPLDVIGPIRTSGGMLMWGGGQLELQYLNEGDPADQRFTELIASGGMFTGRFVNDAYSVASNWLEVFRNSGTYTTSAVTFPAGNVGIGTTTPLHKLTINDGTGDSSSNSALVAVEGASNKAAVRLLKAGNAEFTTGIDTSNNLRIVNTNGGLDLSSSSNGITMTDGGCVGIGTTDPNPTYELSVAGTILAKGVVVQTGWADYVFDQDYHLKPLNQLDQEIQASHHLPGIPSAKEVAEHGADVGAVESKLLAKVEELTLYVIDENKRLERQSAEVHALQDEVTRLRAENDRLERRSSE